uniref:Uncharacterized protein n=1 Tax=Strongyloides venezuelensis TaxID=75913 RepID=A0A0K0FCJ8_STRVS
MKVWFNQIVECLTDDLNIRTKVFGRNDDDSNTFGDYYLMTGQNSNVTPVNQQNNNIIEKIHRSKNMMDLSKKDNKVLGLQQNVRYIDQPQNIRYIRQSHNVRYFEQQRNIRCFGTAQKIFDKKHVENSCDLRINNLTFSTETIPYTSNIFTNKNDIYNNNLLESFNVPLDYPSMNGDKLEKDYLNMLETLKIDDRSIEEFTKAYHISCNIFDEIPIGTTYTYNPIKNISHSDKKR